VVSETSRWAPNVHDIGDVDSPKNVFWTQDQRYQNVRIIAVYETDQIPALRE